MSGVLQHCRRCGSRWVRVLWDFTRGTVVCTVCLDVDIPEAPSEPPKAGGDDV